jgi:hypothetical protein
MKTTIENTIIFIVTGLIIWLCGYFVTLDIVWFMRKIEIRGLFLTLHILFFLIGIAIYDLQAR